MSDNQSMNLRSNLFMIGKRMSSLNKKKLPTNKQVLQLLYHHSRNLKKSIDDSVVSVISEVREIWNIAEIPTQIISRCKLKLKTLHKEYRNAQKHVHRPKETKEKNFSSTLNQLFDIAHGNVFELIGEEKKQFLIDQRSQRIFHLTAAKINETTNEIAEVLLSPENNNQVGDENKVVTQADTFTTDPISKSGNDQTSDIDALCSSGTPDFMKSSGETVSNSQSTLVSEFEGTGRYYKPKNIRGTTSIFTDDVVAAFDSCKISYRGSVRLVSALAPALGLNPHVLILNKSSYHGLRSKIRKKMAENIKILFGESVVDSGMIHYLVL
ncbi:uncharacterized protein LOC126765166 [Bactrocera neohumeralis]|uniref:uncharacterized protein LOC126765166 n=1 Tax=Bactrocera neohumeralis TaxID=98809 RepID=UPI002165E2EF|nr:uncharacterized protein LOC126765166 [Bactrocera neohumeralis]